MKIASAALEMESARVAVQRHEIRESLRAWTGRDRPDFEGRGAPASRPPARPDVNLSEQGRATQAGEASAIEEAGKAADNDPMLALLRAVIRYFTGSDAQVFDPAELELSPARQAALDALPDAPPAGNGGGPVGWGVEYERHESYTESEHTAFAARGLVRTADGKEIGFSVELAMSRHHHEESHVSLRLGDAARQRKDPLVLNFGGTAAELTDRRVAFDLDADGSTEQIATLASGSLYLALDRNEDGTINDGRELFGAQSGDGFADLAAHDDDGNGWIDENDAAFNRLRLWNGADGPLLTLAEAGVGALALANVNTRFELRGAGNSDLGAVRASGVFLLEDGKAGTMQQIDLSV